MCTLKRSTFHASVLHLSVFAIEISKNQQMRQKGFLASRSKDASREAKISKVMLPSVLVFRKHYYSGY